MSTDLPDPENGWIITTIYHRQEHYSIKLPDDATVADLFNEIEDALSIPVANQKILVPKGPLLKMPLKKPEESLWNFQGKTLTLMGSASAEVQAVEEMAEKVARRNASRAAQMSKSRPSSRKTQVRSSDDVKYTFLQIRPLFGLPHPQRSEALLNRLKEDPGIRAAMRKHKFTVALLTEMEPLSHTQSTHEGTSRILGLNRNHGEVIELRLRTDAHDGYRDFKTIRKTLCHELAHNVHGPHDRNFWDLCHQVERDVESADWKSSGRTIGETSRYVISGQDEDVPEDHGGWHGGEFILGGISGTGNLNTGLTRREVLAQAALERQRREAVAEREALDGAMNNRSPPLSAVTSSRQTELMSRNAFE